MQFLVLVAVLFLCFNQVQCCTTAGAGSRLPSLKHPTSKFSAHRALQTKHRQENDRLDPAVVAIIPPEGKDKAIKDAINNTIMTMVASFLFGIGTWYFKGKKSAMEYYTGFLVEKSLSIDNLFVFLMLFDYFKIPFRSQGRVLTWGLIGAVVMRGIMIFVGVSAIQKFKWVTLLFAGILLASSYKLMHEGDEDEDEVKENAVMRFTKMIMATTEEIDGEKFFILKEGKKLATPLLTCLVCIELSDFVFAVDSIPAVLGVSKDPFIVYTSNIFAILGMRSLYILISQAVAELKYIKPSVAAVLGFVGCKMAAEYFDYEVSSFHSLLVIIGILGAGIIASVVAKNAENKAQQIAQK
mmetsp:Transcript_10643/g.17912  ORF Transcript_10643/g.17912 Transcript_10643/m.17912 type:complete len:354 (-) Transcript_10643:62-1123(-)